MGEKATGDQGGGNSGIGRLAHVLGRLHRILLGGGEYVGLLAVERSAGGGGW